MTSVPGPMRQAVEPFGRPPREHPEGLLTGRKRFRSLLFSGGSTTSRVPHRPLFPVDPLSHLDRVASRLNRLALQRAAYRTLGLALLSAAILAPAALWLPSGAFIGALTALVVLCLGVGLGSFWALRTRWARRVEAARWVEHEIDLDERLLTLVTAPDETHEGRLWPELETDNETRLDDWKGHKLGIPAVPSNVLLFALGLSAAIFALAPGGGDVDRPPPAPSFLPKPEKVPQRSGAVPQPGTEKAEGALSGDGASGEGEGQSGMAESAITRVKAQLGERFAKSFAARQLGGGTQKEESDGESPETMRGDLPESDLGDSVSQAGGATPPEGMGHIVQDDADDDGQTVRRFEGEGEGGTTGSSQGGVRKGEAPKQGEASGAPSESDGQEQNRDPDSPVMVSEDATETVPGSGGSGPGDMPGTGPLLAQSPLDLSGGRRVARFSLALGALAETEGGEGGTLESDVYSYIAEGDRGEQEADRGVRHQSIPPEYETVIKRVFERNT